MEPVSRAAEVVPSSYGWEARAHEHPLWLCLSAQDAATEHHRLGSLDSRQVYVTLLETGKSKVKLQVH